jgi:dihydrofolate synthase/folylpolyglutamate synthase
MDVELLYKSALNEALKGEKFESVARALEAAKVKALPNDLIFVGGSTFVVAEALP